MVLYWKLPPMGPLKTARTGVRGTGHLVVFLTLVVCIAFAAWRSYSEGEKVFRNEFHRQLNALDQLKINQLMGWQAERKGDAAVAMSSASMMPDLEKALGQAATAAPRVARWMEDIRGSYMYASVELLDRNGNIRLVSGPSLAAPPFYPRLFAETKNTGKAVFRYFPKGSDVLQSMFAACAPIRSQDGALIGALVLTVDPWGNLFPEILKWPTPTRTGRLYLARREGSAVRVIGMKFGNAGAEPEERLVDRSQDASPFVKAVALQEGSLEGLDDAGRRVSGVVRHLPANPASIGKSSGAPSAETVMVALMDESEAFASLRQNQMLLMVASGLLIVLCAAGVGWIWRQQVLQSYRQQLAAEQQRRALIGHYDYLTRYANDAVFLVDGSGRVVQVNERASDYYGYSQEEMIGMNVQDFRAPGTEKDYERARQQIEKQQHAVFESIAVRKDGSLFPVELSVRVMEVEGARYRQSIIRDITERRRAQAQIDRLNRLYAVLSRCGQAIVKAQDESTLFQEVVNVAVDSGRFCIAAVGTVDPAGKMVLAACAGPAAGYLQAIPNVPSDLTLTVSPEGSAGRSGAFVCNDLWREAADQTQPAVEAARRFNVRSLMQAPLWRRGKLAGELRLYSSEPDFFNDEEIGLATEVAENLCFALDSIERKQTQRNVEAELRTNRERLELVLEATEEAYWDWDLESGEVQQSPRYDAMLGYAPGEVPRGYREWLALMHPEDAGRVSRELNAFVSSGSDSYSAEFRMQCRSGEYIWVSCRAKVVRRSDAGSPLRMVGTLTDMTDRKKLEEQFRQSQKLESVGRLAGGIAHDFNNLLTVINGYSRLLIASAPANDPRVRQLEEIRKAGDRAAELTRQLLTFSRKNVSEPRLLNLNVVAAESETILRRLTPDNIEFTASFEAKQDEVVIDPSHLQQVLMNLVVNACDAMTTGGKLTIRTSNVDVALGSAHETEESAYFGAGMWVLLEVMDTGVGMNEDTLRHIFEPFFTTKDVGKGTGLGLSTVYGIVRQCGGIVRVASEPGAGSTFRVYFPVASQGILASGAAQNGAVKALTGSETVLVVEDQDVVRDYTENALRTYGYSVISARSGDDALQMAKQRGGRIDLLLTDVIMPSTNGRTLARELRKSRPETKVLFMSGYVDDILNSAGELEPDAEFLQKPFSPEALAEKVRRTLNKSTVPRTILVVEDEAAVRGIFTEFLGKKHNLLLACDGREALEILRGGEHPDLVITDLVMPNQEGLALIREIRKTRPETRIIAMSGAFSGRFLKTAELLGADATLVKPIRPEVLDQMIEDVLVQARPG